MWENISIGINVKMLGVRASPHDYFRDTDRKAG